MNKTVTNSNDEILALVSLSNLAVQLKQEIPWFIYCSVYKPEIQIRHQDLEKIAPHAEWEITRRGETFYVVTVENYGVTWKSVISFVEGEWELSPEGFKGQTQDAKN